MARKRRMSAGTWITREMARSPAYVALTSSGKNILMQVLLKRVFKNDKTLKNKDNITVTYKELESLGMSRGSITNGLTDVMAKGFLQIIRQGGAYQQDKTVYGLIDNWKFWKKGDPPVVKKQKGKNAGGFALQNKSNHNN